ncbi:hypothetical protein DFJ73DRAFT_97743 [Zopfochytrium polystomum]|nr:hypothetical protein DFJ73DRAFT_97743 [Zopfochytrium polystomum]
MHPLYYCISWIDWSRIPPNPSGQNPTRRKPSCNEFLEELTEILTVVRGWNYGSLVDFGSAKDSAGGNWVCFFEGGRVSSNHTATLIDTGLRGRDLLPGLMKDFAVYTAMRPDVWPDPPPFYSHYEAITLSARDQMLDGAATNLFSGLPELVVVDILSHLPRSGLAQLLLVSRSTHAFISPLLDAAVSLAMRHGDLQWLLPVHDYEGESARAAAALAAWGFSSDTNDGTAGTASFASRGFPSWAFLRAAWDSGPIVCRRWLWGLAKQWERVWSLHRSGELAGTVAALKRV